MRISILIPCYNEERTIKACIESCIYQIRKPDEIIIVDDGSTDKSPEILKSFGKKIKVVRTPRNTGNKSKAQEYGLKFVTGDVFIATDADTILHCSFVKNVEKDFRDKKVAAVAGYVKSLRHNWLTACRELEYVIGQDIHKLAQSYLDAVFVIPGCACAFRTEAFRKYVTFDHDTLTEDLDFTYKLHENKLKIKYNKSAVCYTQDPDNLKSYINQMKRWYSGGWQNLKKHWKLVFAKSGNALEMSLMYTEFMAFSLSLFLVPLINLSLFMYMISIYILSLLILATYSSFKRKRLDLLIYFPGYIFLTFLNSLIFMGTFVKEIVMRKKEKSWNKPDRRNLPCNL